MAGGFPIPRQELPVVSVSRAEHAACRDFMDRMLYRVVSTFESFADQNQRVVDARRWKHMASRDDMTIFSKRKDATTIGVDQYGAVSHFQNTLPPVDLLMTGESPGTVDNTMNAVITASQTELALVVIYLHEDVADCAMLNTMEPPTEDEPYHFLGYKMFVRKSPTSSSIVRHRDSTYLEACGLTTLTNGEQVGYHIMHSVDLADFPPLVDRNCVRSNQSVAYLYRQKYDNVVEVFMIGSLDINGYTGIIKPIANVFIADSLFGIARLIDCSEAKRLTEMVRRHQGVVALTAPKGKLEECMLCRQKKKMFSSSSSIMECVTCGKPVCARCRSTKRIFISDGILGRFEKVEVCKTCVVLANRGLARIVSSSRSAHSTHSVHSAHSGQFKPNGERDRPTNTTMATTDDAYYSSMRAGSTSSSSNASHISSSQGGSLGDSHMTTMSGSPRSNIPRFGRPLSARSPDRHDAYIGSHPRSRSGSVDSDIILLNSAEAHQYQQRQQWQQQQQYQQQQKYPPQHDLYYSNHRRRGPRSASNPSSMAPESMAMQTPPPLPPPRIARQQSLTRSGVFKQLVELQQVAESTYHTTKQTAVHMGAPGSDRRVVRETEF